MAGYEGELQKERGMKDKFMAQHPESPFIIGDVAGFSGLRYFPIDPSYRVPAILQRMERPPEAVLRTNRDGQLNVPVTSATCISNWAAPPTRSASFTPGNRWACRCSSRSGTARAARRATARAAISCSS